MILAIVFVGLAGFALGWVFKDYKWKNAAENGKVMVVDGDMYKVTNIGSAE